MTFSIALELVIGLVLVFYALGLIVNLVLAMIKDMLDLRAEALATVLAKTFYCGDFALFKNFYEHPLIQNLKPFHHKFWQIVNRDNPKVSSIPNTTFSLAILDILASEQLLVKTIKRTVDQLPDIVADKNVKNALHEALQNVDETLIFRLTSILTELSDSQPRAALLSLINLLEGKPEDQLTRVKAGIQALPDGPPKKALASLIDFSMDDVEQARIKIENWYDDILANVSFIFTRQVKFWVYVVAIPIVAILGTDSILIGQTLWEQPVRRAAVVQAVPAFLEEFNPKETGSAPSSAPEDILKRAEERAKEIGAIISELDRLDIPFTWWNSPMPQNSNEWVLRLLGIIITGVAAAQGSSFWYDILKKVHTSEPKKSTS